MVMKLTDQIASRARSLDFVSLGMMLPNPDPILKAKGQDVRVYRDMRSDALIGGNIRRRKSAVKALEWGLDRDKAPSRVAKGIEEMLDGLDLEALIGQMLEATLYGYQPMEVMWERRGGLLVPASVEAVPPEWFGYDDDNQLRFKTKQSPVIGELQPPRKFLVPRQEPTYANPYGIADLSMCFWPLVFKKGGKRFWLGFAEKWGGAFFVGKLPRSAKPEERTALLDDLEALVANGVAVIPDDGSIEPVEAAGKTASSDIYQGIVVDADRSINIALLGQNQTTEANSNRASATAGLEVTAEIRDADAGIVAACVNQLVQWICELNYGSAQAPTFSLWDQKAQDEMRSNRDKNAYAAGARFKPSYWVREYGYQESDMAASDDKVNQGAPGQGGQPGSSRVVPVADDATTAAQAAEFAQGVLAAPKDPLATDVTALQAAGASPMDTMLARLQALVDGATSTEQLQEAITIAYGNLDSAELVKVMAAGLALAALKGMDSVRQEAAASS